MRQGGSWKRQQSLGPGGHSSPKCLPNDGQCCAPCGSTCGGAGVQQGRGTRQGVGNGSEDWEGVVQEATPALSVCQRTDSVQLLTGTAQVHMWRGRCATGEGAETGRELETAAKPRKLWSMAMPPSQGILQDSCCALCHGAPTNRCQGMRFGNGLLQPRCPQGGNQVAALPQPSPPPYLQVLAEASGP